MQGGVDFAAVRARAQRHLLNQRPDRFRRLVTILWVVERFRQPLDLLPIDTRHVRMVCNEGGRCWRERGERRVIIRDPGDSYGYAPRERYIERRGHDDRGGVGFRAPGVSVGIGTDRY